MANQRQLHSRARQANQLQKANKKRAKRLVEQAKQHLKAGDIDRAKKLALEAQKLNPESEGAEEVLNTITRKEK